jgi:hypothetical protein
MSEYVQGYDASLINNVQQLPVWQKGGEHNVPSKDATFADTVSRIPFSYWTFGYPERQLLGWKCFRGVLYHSIVG